MAYQLWLNNMDDIVTFKRKQEGKYYKPCKECFPLQFKIMGKVKDKFSIKEIDSLTCGFKNEDEFIEQLRKFGHHYINEDREEKLLLTNYYGGRLYEKQIIFDDRLLQSYAINNRDCKQNAYTEQLGEFISYIKSIATSDVTSDYLLNPTKVSSLSVDEKSRLKYIFSPDIDKKQGIITILSRYKNYMKEYEFQHKNNLDTIEIERELLYVDKEIKNYFVENYQNLRKMIEWECAYKDILEKKVKETPDTFFQIALSSQLEQIAIYREYRNGISDRRSQVAVLSVDDAKDIYSREKGIRDIENEELLELYSNGGIENVMENMSIDDIYSNPNDAEIIGLISKRK